MKKVAIVTLNGYFNYGNRLQNFALQETIKDMGFKVETLIHETNDRNSRGSNFNKIKKLKKKEANEIYRLIRKKIKKRLYSDLTYQRMEKFKRFSANYIAETDFSISEDNIPSNLAEKYDFFITGSDQVWNPHTRKGSSIEFLTFASQEKRISYAPSFGVSKIPKEYEKDYSLWLSEMAHLSVREEAGAKIIKDLTGRDSSVLLDPTMLLTKEQWLSISNEAQNKPEKKYLLTYFLGDIKKERKRRLQIIAKKNNLEVVNLAQMKDKSHYLSGPSEFIDYINSASLFCTDSFHGAAFSILLNTPFIVFKRDDSTPSMNSRIETLLEKFNLQSRMASEIQNNDEIFNVNLSHTKRIFDEERSRAFEYLKNALKS